MRLFVATLLTAFLFLAPPCQAQKSIKSLIVDTERSIVKIEHPIDVGDGVPHSYICTGFIVDSPKNWVLTARHCIPEDGDVTETLVEGQHTELIKADDNFALLLYDTKMQKPPLQLRKDLPDVGEVAVAFGYGYGELLVLQRHVAEIHVDDDNKDHKDVVTDMALAKGMSGGPIVDADGKVIGISQASNETIGIGCSSKEILKFLKAPKGVK